MKNLREFLGRLERERDLAVIDVPADPHLEIAEIHRRVIAAGGPALLFRRPRGADFPVVTNLFGTARRVDLAFGSRPLELVKRAVEVAEGLFPLSLGKLWKARDLMGAGLRVGLRRGSAGPVTEVLERDPRLSRLPCLTGWPEDAGAFVTLPLVYTEHPRDGRHNLGMYRLQRFDDRHTGMHWQIGKGGGFHHHEAETAGQRLPVTVFLGGPPALIASAIAPLPENVGELILASLLQGAKLRLARSAVGPHPLVAEAEFALVGFVPPGERRPEGPFGDHYGYYSLEHDYPVLHVDALYRRRDAIYPATVVGKPRQEDFYLGDFLQELLSPLFPLVMPAVRSLWSYGETGYHSLAAAVVRDRYPREAMASAFRILGEGQLSLTKFLLLTDAARDLTDFRGLLEHLLARVVWERDLFVFSCVSMDTLDYTGPKVNEGSKGVLLGLGDPVRELPRAFVGTLPPECARVEVFCPGCLVIETPPFSADPAAVQRLARDPRFGAWPLLIGVDDARGTVRSVARFLWTVFTRFEPGADIHAAEVSVVRNHPTFRAPIAIDARTKPSYPRELFCDPETAQRVTDRWREYFPNGGVEMGDSDAADLG
ncbi:MAG: UbiD family decarboxylase [Planctomycetota bacterium]